MRMLRGIFGQKHDTVTVMSILLLMSPPSLVLAQDPSGPLRTTEAAAVLARAIDALGGRPATLSVKDVVIKGTVEVSENGVSKTGQFVWEQAGEEFRRQLTSDGQDEVFLSGHGNPAFVRGEIIQQLSNHVILASPSLYLPSLVLLRLYSGSDYSLTIKGERELNGRQAVCVQTRSESGLVATAVTPQEWLFDVVSGLPLQVRYKVPRDNNALEQDSQTAEFGDYRVVGNLVVPFRIVVHLDDRRTRTFQVLSVLFNQGIAPERFDWSTRGIQ